MDWEDLSYVVLKGILREFELEYQLRIRERNTATGTEGRIWDVETMARYFEVRATVKIVEGKPNQALADELVEHFWGQFLEGFRSNGCKKLDTCWVRRNERRPPIMMRYGDAVSDLSSLAPKRTIELLIRLQVCFPKRLPNGLPESLGDQEQVGRQV